MKKKILFFLSVGLVLITMISATRFTGFGFGDSTGAPLKKVVVARYTGCDNTSCHSSKPTNDYTRSAVDVLSDIPLTGWLPNTTYTITVKAHSPDRYAYGFLFTTWGKQDSITQGTITTLNTDVQITKSLLKNAAGNVVDSNFYATHTKQSVSHGTTSNSWQFKWTTPAVKKQEVRFYLAAICANANGLSSGDYVYYVNKNADSSSIPNIKNVIGINKFNTSDKIEIYPTVTKNNFTINIQQVKSKNLQLVMMDMNGKVVLSQALNASAKETAIDIYNLPTGQYIVSIQGSETFLSKKITKL